MSNFWVDLPALGNVQIEGTVSVDNFPAVQPVSIVPPSGYLASNVFGQIAAVASGTTQNIVSYTVPSNTSAYLVRATFGGQNIATYTVMLNSNIFDMKRTYYGSDLSESLEYTAPPLPGFLLNAGDVISLQVTNFQPSTANFEGALYIIEVS